MIEIKLRQIKGISIVDIQGKLDTPASLDLEIFLTELLTKQVSAVLINFSEMEFISSSGLREILKAGKKLFSEKGKLVMCAANPIVADVLRVSGFSVMFEAYESEMEAIASFQ